METGSRRGRHMRAVVFALLSVLLSAPAVAAGDQKPFVTGSWAEILGVAKGRPTIVHFWGLTCGPCRTEMPEWGKLPAEIKARLIVIHAERAPARLDSVGAFLTSSGLDGVESWYFADRFQERLRFEIDPGWQGETPMTLLIAADGARRSIVGPADLAELRNWLDAEMRK